MDLNRLAGLVGKQDGERQARVATRGSLRQ